MKFNTKAYLLLLCLFLFIGSTNGSTASQIANPSARTDDKEFELVKSTFKILLNRYAHPLNADDLFLEAARGIIDLQGINEIFKKRGINIQVLSSGPIKTFSSNTTISQVQNELERMYALCIRKNPHIEPIQIAELMVDSMLKSLDDNSALYNPETYKDVFGDISRTFYGTGLFIDTKDGKITVISSVENSTAYKAGILSHDKILKVNGSDVNTLLGAVRKIRGPKGTQVKLTIQRDGFDTPLVFNVKRSILTNENVKFADLGNKILYIRISNFAKNTALKFQNAFNQFLRLNRNIHGLVLDLRDNGGGLLDETIKISDFLLDKGDIVKIKRVKRKNLFFRSKNITIQKFPIVTLINKGTASSSEIIAAALKDNHRSIIIGRTSFGKGSVYTLEPIGLGYALRYTSGLYESPGGYIWHNKGISPDFVFEYEDYKTLFKKSDEIKYNVENLHKDKLIHLAITILNKKDEYFKKDKVLFEKLVKKDILFGKEDKSYPSKNDLYLLSIGISNYSQEEFRLKYASHDALSFAKAFKDQPKRLFNSIYTKVLTDNNVTRNNVIDSINSFLSQATSEDVIIIFVAGHGIKRRITDTYYFITYDASHSNLTKSAIRWSDFEEEIKILQNQVDRIIIVLDTCHSAALDTSIKGHRVSTDLSTTLQEKGFYVLAASRENEAALEKDDLFHGVFTYSILDGLKGKADFNRDRIIDVIELFNFVEINVAKLTDGYQHPHFIKGGGGLQLFALE